MYFTSFILILLVERKLVYICFWSSILVILSYSHILCVLHWLKSECHIYLNTTHKNLCALRDSNTTDNQLIILQNVSLEEEIKLISLKN